MQWVVAVMDNLGALSSQEVGSASLLRMIRSLTHFTEVTKREEWRPGKHPIEERRACSDSWVSG